MTSFTPGDRVAIIDGYHAGQTGIVIADPSMCGVPVRRDGQRAAHVNRYDASQLIIDVTREGTEALAADAPADDGETTRPLPRRTPRVTLGQVWAAQAAVRAPEDAPIAYVPVQHTVQSSDAVTLSFGGVA